MMIPVELWARLGENRMNVPERTAPDAGLPTHERVYRALRGQIMAGELAPGQALTLRGIAEDFGVSMTPARECIRRLVAEGALKLSVSGRVTTPSLSSDRIEELTSLRALLETELASRALPRAHIALIERMQSIDHGLERMTANADMSGFVRANIEFHRTLYLRAQAPTILALAETVWLQLGPTMRQLYTQPRRPAGAPQHRKIIAALKAGDEPGLRLAIREDVVGGLRRLQAWDPRAATPVVTAQRPGSALR